MFLIIGIRGKDGTIKELGPFNLDELELERLRADFSAYLVNPDGLRGGIYQGIKYTWDDEFPCLLFLQFKEIIYIF